MRAAGRVVRRRVTTVIEKTPTRNHTEVMMRECGAAIEAYEDRSGERISVAGRKPLGALGRYTVAGDLSSASFFIVAAPRPRRRIAPAPHRNQPVRTALIDALKTIGARVEIENRASRTASPWPTSSSGRLI